MRLREPARLRNLELVLLVVAIAISLGAIVLVQLGAIGSLDNGMIVLAAIPCLLAVLAHIGLRITARDADPSSCRSRDPERARDSPMIYRLDIAEGNTGWGGFGVRQIVWTAIAMVLAIRCWSSSGTTGCLPRYRYIAMFTGIALLLLPMLPGHRADHQRRSGLDVDRPVHLPAGRAREDRPRRVLRRLPDDGARLAVDDGQEGPGMRFPRGRDLGPILVIWASRWRC